MARNTKYEADLSGTAAAAAPARRKPIATNRKIHPTSGAKPFAEPLPETVAKLAYSYWEARGFQPGSPEEDWLRAERELRS